MRTGFRRTIQSEQLLSEEVALNSGVDLDARAHGGAHGDALHVLALSRSGLNAQDLGVEGSVVLDELLVGEGLLAQGHMADAIAVGTILNAASLELGNHLGNIHSNGAELGVRHQTTGAEDLTDAANLGHHGRQSDGSVELDVALLDLGDQLVGANDVGTGLTSLISLSTLGEDGDANDLAGAVRQGDGTTDVLIGLTGVDAKAEVSLDGLVKVGGCNLLDERDSLKRGVELSGINLLSGGALLLTVLSHITYLLWSNGPKPSHINACLIARKRARHASCPKLPK